ncbi:hypothetical protein OHB26_21145 [Nocardia sp. NBC_01503]|uniref:hypothetical protein n=1 Tax=Nocardia sp. NBC_01503 TaxID=2975997 RepID=UPI002E7BEC1A|nr:hypothetical protein [Nocardia sp. NBC_01503]WTL29503.1 hypothetical protein OHB26_21145 [Nocardia sp. NBC_01503]
MKVRAFFGVAMAAAAVALAGTSVAHADSDEVNVNDYLIGDTAYFNTGIASCSIKANGDVGCDIQSGIAKWLNIIPITDLAIDMPFLPAHPTFGAFGHYGRSDAQVLGGGPIGYGSTINYAGASCHGGGRGGFSCTAKGHGFSFGWSGTQTS